MLDGRKLIADTFCEVYDLIKPAVDEDFWDFSQVADRIEPGAIYLISRKEFYNHTERIKQIAESGIATIIMSNPHEGSWTIIGQCTRLGINELVYAGKIIIIGGGDMDERYRCLRYDSFLPKVFDYAENLAAAQDYRKQWTADRPYKFLFLNGRARPHRQHLLASLADLLPETLWTNLDSAAGAVQVLPTEYEYNLYQGRQNLVADAGYVKYELFNNEWGEIYLKADPYLATYFSLVTETVFEYPYSFRTEKIAKPLAIGHPFVVASNQGYYRDLRNLGFRTFGHLIDESFDLIDNNDDRLQRIEQTVRDLCSQDLPAFITAAEDVCKYNQQHLAEMRVQLRQEFPQRFEQFIHERSRV